MRLTIVLVMVMAIFVFVPGLYPLTAEKPLEEPKDARPPVAFGRAWKPLRVRITHYCWKEKAERRWKGKTVLNTSARNETGVAVDPKLIPYGTQIYIPDIGVRVADDTGGKCRQYGKKGEVLIDVRWADKTTKELRQMGANYQDVYILEKVD